MKEKLEGERREIETIRARRRGERRGHTQESRGGDEETRKKQTGEARSIL